MTLFYYSNIDVFAVVVASNIEVLSSSLRLGTFNDVLPDVYVRLGIFH